MIFSFLRLCGFVSRTAACRSRTRLRNRAGSPSPSWTRRKRRTEKRSGSNLSPCCDKCCFIIIWKHCCLFCRFIGQCLVLKCFFSGLQGGPAQEERNGPLPPAKPPEPSSNHTAPAPGEAAPRSFSLLIQHSHIISKTSTMSSPWLAKDKDSTRSGLPPVCPANGVSAGAARKVHFNVGTNQSVENSPSLCSLLLRSVPLGESCGIQSTTENKSRTRLVTVILIPSDKFYSQR